MGTNELGILPSLTKDFILSKVSQEQIFEKYLGIPVSTTMVTCPSVIRAKDEHPTFNFKYSDNGKLRARDWAGWFWGDCFDAVAYLLHVDSKSKRGFGVVLDQIARDFRLHKYAESSIQSGSTFDVRDVNTKIKRKTSITFQTRVWNKQDADFWKAGNLNSESLREGRVFACEYIWINNNLIYNFIPKDPAYAYYFTEHDIKIYFPLRKEYRFIGNTNYLPGIDLLIPDEIGIITKSYKDVLSMRTFNLQAISVPSESTPITKEQWFKLKWKCSHWFSLMDYDRQGITMAIKLRNLYGIHPLFFSKADKYPKLASNYKSFLNVKDFYDFVKFNGKDSTNQLIEQVRNYFSKEIDDYNKYANSNLNFIIREKKLTDNLPF